MKNALRIARIAAFAIIACLACGIAFASPLARTNPAAAVLTAALTLWGINLALADTRTAKLYAITVDTALKLDTILTTALVALKRVILPLRAFSTVFKDVPLNGTDVVQVPFIPLESATSTDFDQDDGYVTGDGTVNARSITVNKRKYQALGITGRQLAREPILEIELQRGRATGGAEYAMPHGTAFILGDGDHWEACLRRTRIMRGAGKNTAATGCSLPKITQLCHDLRHDTGPENDSSQFLQ